MKAVADTNVLVSGLLWFGPPHELLIAAERGSLMLYTSPALLVELFAVLSLPKLTPKLIARHATADELVSGYVRLAHLLTPRPIPPVIAADPEDDAILACALSAQADWIISGDIHLLQLGSYRNVRIITPRQALRHLTHR